MQEFFETYHLPWLLKASWQAAVLILLVLTVQWVFGRRLSPRWRYGLWLLVVARLALPWTMPSSVSVFNWLSLPNAAAAVANLRTGPELQGSPPPPTAAAPAESPGDPVPVVAPGFHLLQRRLPHLRPVRPRLDHQPGFHRGQSWRGGTRRHGRFGRQVRHHDRPFLLARRHPRHAVHGRFHDAVLLPQQGPLSARVPEDAIRREDPRFQRLLLRHHDHLLLGHLHVCLGHPAAIGAGMEFRCFSAGIGGHRAGVYFPRRPHQRHL